MNTARLKDISRIASGYWEFIVYTLSNLRVLSNPPVRSVFERQLYFTGTESVYLVVLLGLLAGAAIATQTTSIVGANSELTVRVLVWTVVRELGPLLAAIIIIARSSVAIATELAVMEVRGETDALKEMRISPMDYLVVPRISALTLSTLALTIYFEAVAVIGGLAVSGIFQNVSFLSQLGRFLDVISPADVALPVVKGLCFGIAIAAISCYHGITVSKSATAIPVAVLHAVIRSLISVFLIDALFAWLVYISG
ncbi:MAG TPA: ABC transporter permease [Burkholderiales bacterium]|nr:ABC transporter permease [Burkholderiales bacterium]